jgi:hypothetical protein
VSAIVRVLKAAALATLFGFVTYNSVAYRSISFVKTIVLGICIGAGLLGTQAALVYWLPSRAPLWASYEPLQSLMPTIAGINHAILLYISLTILLLLCVICMNKLTHYGTQRRIWAIVMSFIAGYISAGLLFADNVLLFSITGAVFALFFYSSYSILLRFDYSTLVIVTATYLIGENIQQLFFQGYNYVTLVILTATCFIALFACWWAKTIANFIRER